MPSSMIFASLVVLWLLILVPAVARRRQEVARPSVAALSGRVLERPRPRPTPARGREREVQGMDETDRDDTPARTAEQHDDVRWERPAPRYRPGRGGFDPEAAAAAARARYAFRQRVVLAMLIAAVVTAVVAAVAAPGVWWAHAAVDLALVGYLGYLRRQVRLEEAIRQRRAARMAGTRRPSAADDPELDAWARRGRELTRRADTERRTGDDRHDAADDEYDDGLDDEYDDEYDDRDEDDRDEDDLEPEDHPDDEEPERVTGTGEPLRRTRDRADHPDPVDGEPALPRLRPAPPPTLPAGTSLVEVDEDDPDLYELDGPSRPDYRRAAGE